MRYFQQVSFFLCLSLFFCLQSDAKIKLPSLITDGMVLQRGVVLNIWGWASPAEKVTINFNGKRVSAVTDADGKWLAKLPVMKAGGPYKMEIKGLDTIVLQNILIGDVYLCSGQSNMVHQMKIHNITYASDIAEANYPEIRQFWVPTTTSLTGPSPDLPKSSWKSANSKDVNDFSAVAYFFARQIFTKYKIPVGIINCSVGGTAIESWTSEQGLANVPGLSEVIVRNKDTAYVNTINRKAYSAAQTGRASGDQGLSGNLKWYDVKYEPKGWRSMNIPGYWEDQGIRDLDGVIWYRRVFDVPATMTGVSARIQMGRIVDADRFYINGQQVGSTGYQYPQRRYNLEPGILKPGKNLFVIRVENTSGKGGFVPDKPYLIEAGTQSMDLKGEWKYKVGAVYVPSKAPAIRGISEQAQPTSLYNAMIAPIANYGLCAVLWYQGESNVGNAKSYKTLLPNLIMDWRRNFSRTDLPFYYVQLPNYGDMRYLPAESALALIREGALQALNVPLAGMAVTIDLGEWNDIHPDNKKDVGERLALIARHHIYGEKNLVYSGPVFESCEIRENKVFVTFGHTGTGLTTIDGEAVSQFEIASADKKFIWANAKIDGAKVIVWSDQISEPKYVRYAWSDSPVNPNLYNLEKLPASPFRTDK
ncbi:MAG: sialate O-acetylesterase [Pedobacter sp.]